MTKSSSIYVGMDMHKNLIALDYDRLMGNPICSARRRSLRNPNGLLTSPVS